MKTDEELAREARAGSRRSFEELAVRYRRRLFVYLRPRLGSDQDAEDLVQETFLKLYRNIGSYDPAFRFSTWLYTSASRLAISAYRKRARVPGMIRLEDGRDLPDPRTAGPEETLGSGLWEAARTLGESRFQVLWLRYGEDLEIAEIARAVGRSRLAVRVLLHRGRMDLMRRLGPSPAGNMKVAKAAAAGRSRSG